MKLGELRYAQSGARRKPEIEGTGGRSRAGDGEWAALVALNPGRWHLGAPGTRLDAASALVGQLAGRAHEFWLKTGDF